MKRLFSKGIAYLLALLLVFSCLTPSNVQAKSNDYDEFEEDEDDDKGKKSNKNDDDEDDDDDDDDDDEDDDEPDVEDILEDAVGALLKAQTITFAVDDIFNYTDSSHKNGSSRRTTGIVISDDNISYATLIDPSSDWKAWTQYTNEDRMYVKSYSANSYDAFTISNYIEDRTPYKNFLIYALSNLKDPKIAKQTKNAYTITAKTKWKKSGIKKITLTISTTDHHLTKYKQEHASHSESYYGSSKTSTITGGTRTFSNISYGDSKLDLPVELHGR